LQVVDESVGAAGKRALAGFDSGGGPGHKKIHLILKLTD
jgi:hypothetical protein